MNDPGEGQHGLGSGDPDPDAGRGTGPDAVGSVGDEAAKLIGALTDWTKDQGSDSAGAGAGGWFAGAVRDVREHVGTGEDCSYCPVCQVIHVVRQTSPEVRAHLSVAASSLMQAAAGLLAPPPAAQPRSPSVEKIDLEAGSGSDLDMDEPQ